MSLGAANEGPNRAAAGAGKVVAVVLNWCNEHDTKACVESIQRQDYAPLEILLVDNGSPDGSGAKLRARYPNIVYLQTGKNLGYAGGNDAGMTAALQMGADFVLVVNNDTVMEQRCVRELVRAAGGIDDDPPGDGSKAGTKVGAVGPKILRYDDPARIWFGGGSFDRVRAIGVHLQENELDLEPSSVERHEVSFLTGCCLLIPAEVIGTVGNFREDFFAYAEDVEFCLRLARAGRVMVYAEGARLKHRVPVVGALPSPTQVRLRDRNRRRIVRLHYGGADTVRFALWFYPTRVALILGYLLKGETALARAVIAGMRER